MRAHMYTYNRAYVCVCVRKRESGINKLNFNTPWLRTVSYTPTNIGKRIGGSQKIIDETPRDQTLLNGWTKMNDKN